MRDKRLRTLRTLQEDRRAWADATFPGQPVTGLTAHLKKEVDELVDSLSVPSVPSCKNSESPCMELADILLLLLGVATKMKVSAEALVECAYTKLEKVKQRKHWEALPDGSFHHVDEPLQPTTAHWP